MKISWMFANQKLYQLIKFFFFLFESHHIKIKNDLFITKMSSNHFDFFKNLSYGFSVNKKL